MAPKRKKSSFPSSPAVQDVDSREATVQRNGKPSTKTNSNSIERSSPSGEDDDFEEEEDDEDEEEEDDDDDEEDDEEEDESVDDTGGFDEKFLAQLMTMDPIFMNKSGQNTNPSKNSNEVSSNGTGLTNKDDHVSTHALPISQGTPFPNMPAYASAASTPSNEFYDGAINFLTEVLGSSDPSMWNHTESQNQNEWGSKQYATVQPTANPTHTQTQFKNLQPLIGNLIARLKGQPVEESEQGPRVLEEDLVVLLQSLMAQRQAQEERKNTRRLEKGQKAATPRSEAQQHTQPSQQTNSQSNTSFPTLDEINAIAASFPLLQDQNNSNMNATQQPQAGFSIVDFDFGDDDDDPDFVPNNLSLTQPFEGSSQAFAQALTGTTEQDVNTDAWQQMISSFGNASATTADAPVSSVMPISPATVARRTRSVSKNVENQTLHSTALRQLDNSLPSNALTEDSREDDSSSIVESEEANPKGNKRKKFTAEEAKIRRREANRECARRQRAKKKEETEAIRRELERIQALGIGGSKGDSDNIIDVTQALVGRRKRGRPLGSRNRRTMDDMKRYSEDIEQETEMADLRADNRMLRLEMHRLQEENAKLRANAIRHEEVMQMLGERDLVRNRERRGEGEKRFSYGGRSSHTDGNPIHDVLDEEDDLPNHLSNTQDPARDFLAYNPFRTFQRPTSSVHHNSARGTVNVPGRIEQRQHSGQSNGRRDTRGNGRTVPSQREYYQEHQTSRGANSSNSLQDLLQAATTDMGGYHYT